MLEKANYYPGQKSKEEILMFIHRHIISYVKWIFILFIMLIVPIAMLTVLSANEIIIINETNKLFYIIGVSSYLLFLLAVFITTWIDWYLDVTIVTKKHLININQDELFSRSVAEQSLLRVQDVSAKMKGFWQEFFRFGTVYVETAGEQPNFRMTNIEHPIEVANTIMQIHEELVEEHELGDEFTEGIGMDMIKPLKKKKTVEKQEDEEDYTYEVPEIHDKSPEKCECVGDEKIITIKKPKNATTKEKRINKEEVEKIKKISESTKKEEDDNFEIEKTWIDDVGEKSQLSINKTKKYSKQKSEKINVSNPSEDSNRVEGQIREGEEIKF